MAAGKQAKVNLGMYLPEEIVVEILANLPVKPLVRLSCVCKTWCALILKNPYFLEKHLNKSSNKEDNDPTLIFLIGYHNQSQSKGIHEEILQTNNPSPIVSRNQTRGVVSIGSCNGIICFLRGIDFCLYNPVTLEYLEIPIPPCFERYGKCIRSIPPLDLKAIYQIFGMGFGFDSANNDYKLIITTDECDEIYRLSTNRWSKLGVELECDEVFTSYGVYMSGFCQWTDADMILTFDFKDEIFGNIEYPNQNMYMDRHISVLDDSLALSWNSMRTFKYDVWVMKEYGKTESWAKRFSFSFALPLMFDTSKTITFWLIRPTS